MNRIRELPQNSKIVAMHTDSPDVRSLHFALPLCLFFVALLLLISNSSNIRFSFGMLKVNLTVMLSLELQTRPDLVGLVDPAISINIP